MAPRSVLLLFVLACILATAGCTELFGDGNPAANASADAGTEPAAKYRLTLAQPEESADCVKMDTDVYNIGEVVEFSIANTRSWDLSCSQDPPEFSVTYQSGSGRWLTRMGNEEEPESAASTSIRPGESAGPYRFVTAGWEPGRYRIVTGCGVSREILIRAVPSVIPPGTSCPPPSDTAPYIAIDPISDQYTGDEFTITGTTNLDAGEDLQYSIFAIPSETGDQSAKKLVTSTIRVLPGSCGTGTWSVYGLIEAPGEYFIGISGREDTVSAVKRFTILSRPRTAASSPVPVGTTAPGIATG